MPEFWWNDTVLALSRVATLAIGLIEARYLLKEWLEKREDASADCGRHDESMWGASRRTAPTRRPPGASRRTLLGEFIILHHP